MTTDNYSILNSWSTLAPVLSKMVSGVGYRLVYKGTSVAADYKDKKIYISPYSVGKDMEGSFRGFVFHELSHVIFHFTHINFEKRFEKFPEEQIPGRHMIHNCIIDPHGNELMKIFFLGSKQYIDHIHDKSRVNFQAILKANWVIIPGEEAPKSNADKNDKEHIHNKYNPIDHVFLALCSCMYKAQGRFQDWDFTGVNPKFVEYYNKTLAAIEKKFLEIVPIISKDRQNVYNQIEGNFDLRQSMIELLDISNAVYDILNEKKDELKVPQQISETKEEQQKKKEQEQNKKDEENKNKQKGNKQKSEEEGDGEEGDKEKGKQKGKGKGKGEGEESDEEGDGEEGDKEKGKQKGKCKGKGKGKGKGEGEESNEEGDGEEGDKEKGKQKGKCKGKGKGKGEGEESNEEGDEEGEGDCEGKGEEKESSSKPKTVILRGGDQYEEERRKLTQEFIYQKKEGHGYASDPSHDKIEKVTKQDIEAYRTIRSSIPPHLNMLKSHLRQLLIGKMRIRQIGGQYEETDSELDFGALTDIHMRKENVWVNKYNIQTVKNTAVHLLLDSSGSMSGSKEELVAQLAVLFGECLDNLCKFKISSFTTNSSGSYGSGREMRHEPLWIKVFKDWNDNFMATRATIPAYSAYHNNVDGESVQWACNDLLMRPEEKKVLFVFSDGMPNCAYDEGKLQTHLKNVIKEYSKHITIVGIGILSSSVEWFYDKFINVSSLADLGDGFFSKLKEVLSTSKVHN